MLYLPLDTGRVIRMILKCLRYSRRFIAVRRDAKEPKPDEPRGRQIRFGCRLRF